MKIGIMGCSNIAQREIVPAIKSMDNLSLVGFGSSNREKRKTFSKEWGVVGYSYEDLLGADDVEGVYVSLPVGMHYQWGKRVLESGKHLLLEKTFTTTLAEAQKLFELAEKKNLIVKEALMYKHHPLFSIVHEKIPELGDVFEVAAYFGIPSLPEGNFRNQASLGGGAVLDALVYPLSFALSILGEEAKLVDKVIDFDQQRGIDVKGLVRLQMGQTIAQVGYGFDLGYRNEYTIWGSKGVLRAERVFSRPAQFSNTVVIDRSGQKEEFEIPAANHFSLMLDDFCSGSRSSLVNGREDVLRRINLIEQIRSNL